MQGRDISIVYDVAGSKEQGKIIQFNLRCVTVIWGTPDILMEDLRCDKKIKGNV